MVIVVATALVPILNEQSESMDELDNTTYTNEPKTSNRIPSAVKMDEMSGSNDIAWDGTTLTFNDSAVDMTYWIDAKPLVIAQNTLMTYQSGSWSLTMCGTLNDASNVSTRTIRSTTEGLTEMSMSIEDTNITVVWTVSETTNTVTITQEWGFIPSNTGEYVGLPYTAISNLYYTDSIWAASNSNGYMISYSLDYGSTINDTATTSNNTSTMIENTDIHDALVGANLADDSISVNSTLGNPQRLFQYVVPASVTYSSGDSDSAIGLISIIPAIAIMAILLIAAKMVVTRYD